MNCEAVKQGGFIIDDPELIERFNYLCENADKLSPGLNNAYSSKNFFEIGADIPMAGFLVDVEVDPEGISVVEPSNEDIKRTNSMDVVVDDTDSDDIFDDSSELPRYMIYMMAGIVVFLILIFIVWYCARKRMMIKVREKIHNLRI